MTRVVFLPVYRWMKWKLREGNNLQKVTQPISCRAEFESRLLWFQNLWHWNPTCWVSWRNDPSTHLLWIWERARGEKWPAQSHSVAGQGLALRPPHPQSGIKTIWLQGEWLSMQEAPGSIPGRRKKHRSWWHQISASHCKCSDLRERVPLPTSSSWGTLPSRGWGWATTGAWPLSLHTFTLGQKTPTHLFLRVMNHSLRVLPSCTGHCLERGQWFPGLGTLGRWGEHLIG
jgi:hypothetical protein